MEDEKAVVISEQVLLGTLQATSPKDVIVRATDMADVLADIINKRKLFSSINGKKYVRVEGWSTLGAMLGVLPREVSVSESENGDFEASVELIRTSDGMVIGRASAIVSSDEKNWANRERFARRSMAITRATGKAYRLGFAWIMTLAGYEGTPAEEMVYDAEVVDEGPKSNGKGWKPEQVQALMQKYGLNHAKHAISLMNLSKKLTPDTPVETVLGWAHIYRDARDNGKMETAEAAQVADGQVFGEEE